jgi:hypothetical protein
MYLDVGFEKFARVHNVSVFDYSSCCRYYHIDDSGDDSDGQLSVGGCFFMAAKMAMAN